MCAKTHSIRLVLPGCGKWVEGEGEKNSLPCDQIHCGLKIVSVEFASLVAATCDRAVLGLEESGELRVVLKMEFLTVCLGP